MRVLPAQEKKKILNGINTFDSVYVHLYLPAHLLP